MPRTSQASLRLRRLRRARNRRQAHRRRLEHVCTKKCLRSVASFGQRWYYCAKTPVTVVRIPRPR